MGVAEDIYMELKSRLDTDVYPGGSRFPSESMLAEEFSVNKMTMNKVVAQLAREHYLQRGIGGAGTRVVRREERPGGLLAFLGQLDSYTSRVLKGVMAEVSRYNYALLTESPSVDSLEHRLCLLKNLGVEGVISLGYGVPELPGGMRLCCVDYGRPPAGVRSAHFIDSDDSEGGYQLMNEILRRGHREILIFSAVRFRYDASAPVASRVCGFQRAMEEYGIEGVEERTFYSAPDSLADARQFLRDYLKQYPETTLIAADSDYGAELICQASMELGINCPGRIALTGYGNVTSLPLASVNQNPERQGELAVRYLVDPLRRLKVSEGLCEIVETSLIHTEHIPILR